MLWPLRSGVIAPNGGPTGRSSGVLLLTLSRRNLVAGALIGAVGITVPVAVAAERGGGSPANKAVAAGSHTQVLAPGTNVALMSATFKTSKPTDLLISVSLECSILTDVIINGSPVAGAVETTRAQGAVRVWAELDGRIVPIQDVSAPPQDPADSGNGDDSDKVTFCDRVHERTVSDREDEQDGIDGSQDYQATKSANAFNWIRLNAGSGTHELVVKADLSASGTGSSSAQAVIGNRTLIIEPTKLANNASIGENGTSTSGS